MSIKSLKYPNISAGYLLKPFKNSSLNSSFFEKIFISLDKDNERIQFPQRIPKIGYFEELSELEGAYFKREFSKVKSAIKSNLLNKDNSFQKYINYFNILIRFAMYDDLLKFKPKKNFSDLEKLTVSLLKEQVRIEKKLSSGKIAILNKFSNLLLEYTNTKKTDIYNKLYFFNRIIVLHYRNKAPIDSNLLEKFKKIHLEDLKTIKKSDFTSSIIKSICYRGLAMIDSLPKKIVDRYLKNAISFAKSITPKNSIQKIIMKDNLFTCLQTIYKWSMYKGDINEAKKSLISMIRLDPNDSVAHSEFALFYMKIEKYSLAKNYFLKAIKLGPPSVPMNHYFLALCFEKLGKHNEAIKNFELSFLYDDQALSPILDLVHLYKKDGNKLKAKKYASEILKNGALKSQATRLEIKNLESLLNRNMT